MTPALQADFLKWVTMHGPEAGDSFPGLLEQKHYTSPITPQSEEEWQAIRRYEREMAEAHQELQWKVKQAGINFLRGLDRLAKSGGRNG
jgi:hypothetical protein